MEKKAAKQTNSMCVIIFIFIEFLFFVLFCREIPPGFCHLFRLKLHEYRFVLFFSFTMERNQTKKTHQFSFEITLETKHTPFNVRIQTMSHAILLNNEFHFNVNIDITILTKYWKEERKRGDKLANTSCIDEVSVWFSTKSGVNWKYH